MIAWRHKLPPLGSFERAVLASGADHVEVGGVIGDRWTIEACTNCNAGQLGNCTAYRRDMAARP
jgi:hypothetical protein